MAFWLKSAKSDLDSGRGITFTSIEVKKTLKSKIKIKVKINKLYISRAIKKKCKIK